MARVGDRPEPAGFGNCSRCAYRMTGPMEVCFGCATKVLAPLAARRCMTCDQELGSGGRCGNPMCNRSVTDRGWDVIWAISTRTGALETAISLYKYSGKRGWGMIFARVLVGYLNENDAFKDYDYIVPMPTYVGPGGRDFDHTGFVIQRAAVEGPRWPFAADLIQKTRATPALAGPRTFVERATIAETDIRNSLQVTRPELVDGSSVLVFDDVFTGGLTLREVAYKLKGAGATRVSGIVLARQPFRGGS